MMMLDFFIDHWFLFFLVIILGWYVDCKGRKLNELIDRVKELEENQ